MCSYTWNGAGICASLHLALSLFLPLESRLVLSKRAVQREGKVR